jgi:ankyrin repeat protein
VGQSRREGDCAREEQLLRQQRPDGGWAQIPNRESDAYATGKAVVALNQAGGLSPQHSAFVRGTEFLLNTQKPDGSWLVETRRTIDPALAYFESGFPHGKHQFISYAATAWATMALTLRGVAAMSDVLMGAPSRAAQAPADDVEMMPLIRTALDGTADDLQNLLQQGLDANAVWSEAGLTPLMCAVHDPAKVELLLSAGARVNTSTKSGETALVLAAGYNGAADSVRLLLDRGADVQPRSRGKTSGDALEAAAARGDAGVMSMLLDRGAPVNDLPKGSSALLRAVGQGDVPTASFLISRGAQVTSTGPAGFTALTRAINMGYLDMVKLLLERGASINERNPSDFTPDFTPLMHAAAAVDRGNTIIIEMLLAAGADVRARTAAGETASALAGRYGKTSAAKVLHDAEARAALQ